MEFGESIKQTAVRETLEETGIQIEVTGLVGIYTNPGRRIEYTSDGEVRQEFSIVFHGRPVGGSPATSSESSQVEWIEPHRLDQLPMNAEIHKRIDQALSGGPEPYLG
jgi:8-oxo-dGTP pyrophosphatase MutT (NUDIX family)